MTTKDTPKTTPLDGIASAIAADPALQGDNINGQGEAPGGEDQAEQAEQQKPKISNAQAIAGAIAMGNAMFAKVSKLESTKAILNNDTCVGLGALWGPVCDKYGIDLAEYMGEWTLEITAALCTWEIVQALREAVRNEIKQKAQAEQDRTVEGVTGNAVPA